MKNIYFENGVLFYYGNPAGYLHGGTVVLDCVFDRAELVRYIREKEGAKVEVREGVYDRLSEGTFETAAESHMEEKRLRIYQLGRESPLMMRFVSLAERKKRGYGQPQKSEYILVYEGEAGGSSLMWRAVKAAPCASSHFRAFWQVEHFGYSKNNIADTS